MILCEETQKLAADVSCSGNIENIWMWWGHAVTFWKHFNEFNLAANENVSDSCHSTRLSRDKHTNMHWSRRTWRGFAQLAQWCHHQHRRGTLWISIIKPLIHKTPIFPLFPRACFKQVVETTLEPLQRSLIAGHISHLWCRSVFTCVLDGASSSGEPSLSTHVQQALRERCILQEVQMAISPARGSRGEKVPTIEASRPFLPF